MKLDDKPTDPQALREIANSDEMQEVCLQWAKDIQRDARRLVPKRSRNLSRHIEIEEYTDLRTGIDGYAVGWGDKGWYGMMVELGTEDTDPQPHLVPAAIKNGATAPGLT